MTYYGHLLTCGNGSQLKSSRAVDLFKTLNAALENDVIKFIGNVWDAVTGEEIYFNVTEGVAMMEQILKVLSQEDNYDNVLEILYNPTRKFSKTSGSDDVVGG